MEKYFVKSIGLLFILSLLFACGSGGGGGTGTTVIPDPGTGQGTVGVPISLGTATISYNGAVGAYASSYYTFKTGTSTTKYTISLTNIQSDLRWVLYLGSDFSYGIVDFCDDGGTGVNEVCTTTYALDANTNYYLMVYNMYNDVGSTYNLSIAAAP